MNRRRFIVNAATGLLVPFVAQPAVKAAQVVIFGPRIQQGVPFVPTSISSLKLWLSARDLTTLFQDSGGTTPVTSNSDPVGKWSDKSGNGNHVTQSTSGKRPLYKTSIINGQPVIRLDGVDDFLNVPAIDLSGTSKLTFYFVGLVNTSATISAKIFEFSSNFNSFTDSFVFFKNTSDQFTGAVKGNVGTSTRNTTGTITSAKLCSSTLDMSLSVGNEVVVRLNQSTAGTTSASSENTGSFGNRASFMGARNGGGSSDFLGMDYAELLLFAGSLTAGDIANMDAYLNSPYALY